MTSENNQPVVIVQDGQAELIPFVEGDQWRRAIYAWVAGKKPNTQRAYLRIVGDFFQFANVTPDTVTPDMVTAWKLHLASIGRKDSTIAQRVAGLSSCFAHLVKHGLLARNPVDLVERKDLDVSPYGNARPLTMTDFTKIWAQLDETTASGALYRALFLTYVLTGRRRSEVLDLHGRDLQVDGDQVWYRYRGKGGKQPRKVLPPAAWREIQNYLRVTGRELQDDQPVFAPTQPTGSYVTGRGEYVERTAGHRVSGTAVQDALKRAAERAGVNPDRVTLHGMRHLSASIHFAVHGGDVVGVKNHLDHSSLAVTDIYLQSMGTGDKTHYDDMAAMLFGAVDLANK